MEVFIMTLEELKHENELLKKDLELKDQEIIQLLGLLNERES